MLTDTIVRTADGATLHATLCPGSGRGAVVFASALGVPRRFYGKLAGYLAERGYGSLSFDHRGVDGSGPEIAPRDVRLEHWGERDLEAALRAARAELATDRVFLVGHSLGGQIAGLAPSAEGLAGLVLVGACAPHPSRYPPRDRARIELMWRVLVPLLGRRAMFPARRIGLGASDLPTTVIRRWRDWGLTPEYLFDPRHGVDVDRYPRLRQPMLSWSFGDDPFASRAAVEALHAHYPAVRLTHRHLDPGPGESYGHFGYFRRSAGEPLWAETADWLDAV